MNRNPFKRNTHHMSYRKASVDSLRDLEIRVARLENKIVKSSSEEMIKLTASESTILHASDRALFLFKKGAPSVTIDARGTRYDSFTAEKLRKALIVAMVDFIAKQHRNYENQNARLESEIAELRGTGKRISKAKHFEIRLREGMLISRKGFQELEDKEENIKKIEVTKQGGFFIVEPF